MRPLGVVKARSSNWTTGSPPLAGAGAAQELLQHRRVRLDELGLDVLHRPCQPAEDLLVRQRVAERVGCLDLRRERQVEVGADEVVELEEARRGQDDVGVPDGVRREQIHYDGE